MRVFRIGLGASLLGIGLCVWAAAAAQSGPAFEVSARVVWILTWVTAAALVLAIGAAAAAVRAGLFPAIPGAARAVYAAANVLAAVLAVALWTLEPAQFPVRYPGLSRVIAFSALPAALLLLLLFWIVVFRLARPRP
jgi:hypothetical protein